MIQVQNFDERIDFAILPIKIVDQSEADNTEMNDDTTKWSNQRPEDKFLILRTFTLTVVNYTSQL